MTDVQQPPAILEYQGPAAEAVDVHYHFKRMRFWRSVTGACLVLLLFGFINIVLAIIPLFGALVSAVLTLKHLWLAGYVEAGIGYATRHLVLAIILLPWGFFGILLVPILMESDMLKWHWEEDREAWELQDSFED